MRRIMLLVMVMCIVVGMNSTAQAKQRNIKPETSVESSKQQTILTTKEKHSLESWVHAAELAEDVDDYETAIHYYTLVKENFADTLEGLDAEKSLENILKRRKSADKK
ncbi:MAG: hypothetical protein GY853_09150 [PVC group bacterium]|nr:hypothetical protein [PVC group bacterium]